MAGETLQDSLSGLRFSGADNSWGLGASALASSLPALINPRSSVGRNLAIGLGGTLLTALLGYQARQQASEDTIATMDYGNQILKMTNPDDQLALAKRVGEQDSQRGARLATLVNALGTSRLVNSLELARQTELENIKARSQIAQNLNMDPAELPGYFTEKKAAQEFYDAQNAQDVANTQVGVTDPQALGAALPVSNNQPDPMIIRFGTAQAIQNEQKRVSDLNQQTLTNKNAAEAAKFARGNEINNRSTALSNNDLSKNLLLARGSLEDLKNIVKSPTAFAGETMSKIFERIVNPANMVTLQELGTYANAQSLYDKLQGQWAKISAGEATTTPQFKAELIEFAQMAVDARGTLYNTMVQTAVDRANEQGLETTFKIMAPMPRYVTRAEDTESLREINAALLLDGVDEGTKQRLRAQAVIIKGRR